MILTFRWEGAGGSWRRAPLEEGRDGLVEVHCAVSILAQSQWRLKPVHLFPEYAPFESFVRQEFVLKGFCPFSELEKIGSDRLLKGQSDLPSLFRRAPGDRVANIYSEFHGASMRGLEGRVKNALFQKHSMWSQAFISGTCRFESWSGSE